MPHKGNRRHVVRTDWAISNTDGSGKRIDGFPSMQVGASGALMTQLVLSVRVRLAPASGS